MTAEAASIETERPAEVGLKQAGKTRLLTLDDLDGRTRAAQHVKDTRQEVMSDLGGEDRLSTLERAAADHVAMLDTMVKDAAARWLMGEPIEVSSIATLVNAFNRSAAVLGWKRRAKDAIDLTAYARHMATAKQENR